MLRSSSLRISSSLLKQFQRCTSSTPKPALSTEKVTDEVQEGTNVSPSPSGEESSRKELTEKGKARSNLVTAAFASLQHNQSTYNSRNPLDTSIKNANTPEELLVLSQNSVLTKGQALKIVSTLADWSLNGKVTNDDFESDPRFVALCQLAGKSRLSTKNNMTMKEGDLSVVLGVMGEDEAAKMINSISLPQMIKVLSSLSYKRRRSLPLLKALAFNIGGSAVKLDVKQSADILYALASLNFPDEVLLEKVCSDLMDTIPPCQKSAVIGSICTSIGFLRYKDTELLESLCDWGLRNKSISRHQDFVSLLLCLASVKHVPSKELLEVILSQLSDDDSPSASTWLDVVWALAVLESAPESHLSSVLRPKFIERLTNTSGSSAISWKRKLLNVNGVAKLTKGYKGPLLKEEATFEVPCTRSKDKQHLYNSVIDTLSNLFPSANHFRTSVDTGMGFLIDAECMFDAKLNPLPVIDKKTGEPILTKNGKRIALLIHDYHDCTRGRVEPNGASSMNAILAGLSGYKVIPLLYSDYNPQSKLLDRAKYIDGLIKTAASATV